MSTKLYVGNLGSAMTSADLNQMFSQYGSVKSAKVIEDRDTGRSKGFGFVEMASPSEAEAATAGIDGQEHDGRSLSVKEAKPREDRNSVGGGRSQRY